MDKPQNRNFGIRKAKVQKIDRPTHYIELAEAEILILKRSFGDFVLKALPDILSRVLTIIIPKILASQLSLSEDRTEIKNLYTNMLNIEIFKHFSIINPPNHSDIWDHINGKKSLYDLDIPDGIVLIYGESGIFNILILTFLMCVDMIDLNIHNITSWAKLKEFIDTLIVHEGKNNYIFKNDGIHCAGKGVAVAVLKILLLNFILHKNNSKHTVFIPKNFYSDREMEAYFDSLFSPKEL